MAPRRPRRIDESTTTRLTHIPRRESLIVYSTEPSFFLIEISIMPVELRKRKAPEAVPAPAPKKTSKVAKAAAKVKEVITGKAEPKKDKPAVGDVIALDGFGGQVETHDGNKTTLKALVEESKSGVVLFTYPKASTPGCTSHLTIDPHLSRISYTELPLSAALTNP